MHQFYVILFALALIASDSTLSAQKWAGKFSDDQDTGKNEDHFAEEQFENTGWPGRRGEELSDELSRDYD